MPRRHEIRATRQRLEAGWLTRHRRFVVTVVIAVSIAARLMYFRQLNPTPFVELHRWRQTDMNYYDRWARQIAAGDWRSASVNVPMHRWHRDVAERYFAEHPGQRAELERTAAQAGSPADPEAAIWAQWMRAPRFYQDPLYAYLIAMTYRLAGADVRYVFAWQLAVGVLTNVLIWLLARRFFGDAVAACAGALAALSGPMMFYELLLLRDSLIVFTGLALVWMTDFAIRRNSRRWFVVLGLGLGVACLLKSTFLLFSAGAVTMMLIELRTWSSSGVTSRARRKSSRRAIHSSSPSSPTCTTSARRS
jgi:hypothetical protein